MKTPPFYSCLLFLSPIDLLVTIITCNFWIILVTHINEPKTEARFYLSLHCRYISTLLYLNMDTCISCQLEAFLSSEKRIMLGFLQIWYQQNPSKLAFLWMQYSPNPTSDNIQDELTDWSFRQLAPTVANATAEIEVLLLSDRAFCSAVPLLWVKFEFYCACLCGGQRSTKLSLLVLQYIISSGGWVGWTAAKECLYCASPSSLIALYTL